MVGKSSTKKREGGKPKKNKLGDGRALYVRANCPGEGHRAARAVFAAAMSTRQKARRVCVRGGRKKAVSDTPLNLGLIPEKKEVGKVRFVGDRKRGKTVLRVDTRLKGKTIHPRESKLCTNAI